MDEQEIAEDAQDAKDVEDAKAYDNLEQENLRLHARLVEATDIIESYKGWALNEDATNVVERLDRFLEHNPPKAKAVHEAWRIGERSLGHTAIYEGDKCIGMMDHAWDSMTAVLAVNSWKADQEIRPTFEWAKEQSELAYARGLAEANVSEVAALRDIIGAAAHEALNHHDYDDPEHTITMHTKDLPDAYREACKAIGAASRILAVEDVGGGTLADRGLVRLEAVVKFLREREAKLQKHGENSRSSGTAVVWDAGALIELDEIIEELENGALTK